MKRTCCFLLCITLLCALTFSSCSQNVSAISKSGFYLDTVITITLYNTEDEALLKDGLSLCHTYDQMFSKTNQNSDIYKINNSHGMPVTVSDETIYLLKEGISFYQQTDGLFDISIGAVSKLWNFKSDAPSIPASDILQKQLALVDCTQIHIEGNTVTVPDGMEFDLGGIAKGYIGDKMKEMYEKKGVTNGLLNLGGNIICIGTPLDKDSFHIGIQKPFSENETIYSLHINDKCVVTSGIYERCFTLNGQLYHHILNPKNGYPIETDLYSVSIVCDNSMLADVLSTSALMLGLEDGSAFIKNYDHVQAIFITTDYEVVVVNS